MKTAIERFLEKTVTADAGDCLLWAGSRNAGGYGYFWEGKTYLAHRWQYARVHGPIPEGLQIDHLCNTRNCVNPAHLEAVTNQENSQRAIARGAIPGGKLDKMHCPQGHPYSGANLRTRPDGSRSCRACEYVHHAKSRLKKRLRAHQGNSE